MIVAAMTAPVSKNIKKLTVYLNETKTRCILKPMDEQKADGVSNINSPSTIRQA